jgi:hypothetical protein
MSLRTISSAFLITFFLSTAMFFTGCSATHNMKPSTPPIVKKIDHIVLLASDPAPLFDLFTKTLGLPIAWRFTDCSGFATGGIQMGNVNIETLSFPKNTPPFYSGAPPLNPDGANSSIYGIVLEPYPLSTVMQELQIRGTSPSEPYDEMRGDKKLWSNVFLKSLGLDSYIVYLCEYSPEYKQMLDQHKASPPLGGIGLLSVKEVIVGTKDLAASRKSWGGIIDPVKPIGDSFGIGAGPAVRLIRADENKIVSIVLEVASLESARSFLGKNGLLGTVSADSLTVNPSKIQALDIIITEK